MAIYTHYFTDSFALFLFSFLASMLTTFLIIKFEKSHCKFSHDHELSGVQKFHETPVPRIGGLSLLAAGFTGFFYLYFQGSQQDSFFLWLICSSLPIFLGGLLEDLTKRMAAWNRLLLAFISSVAAFYGLNVGLVRIGWGWFDDTVLVIQGISLLLTVVMVGGVSHATNIIDGFNGLLLGFSLLVLSVFAWVTVQVGDGFLLSILLIMIGAVSGLLLFNFPKGRIFTGDGGAYLIGFLLAECSLLLVARNKMVSPWFPLLVMSYPVFETAFSSYRKKVLRKMSPGQPDGIHLHMLVYKRIIPQWFGLSKRDWRRNAMTAVVMWGMSLISLVPALFWWDNDSVMIFCIVVFCVFYVWFYFRIVKFRVSNRYKQLIAEWTCSRLTNHLFLAKFRLLIQKFFRRQPS